MAEEKIKKPFYKKWWFWLIVVVVFIGVVGGGNDDDETTDKDDNDVEVSTEEKADDEEEKKEDIEQEVDEEVEEIEEEEPEEEPIPDAITYEGNGDDVIDVEKTEEGPLVLYIKGNDSSSHFAVKGSDDNDNDTELFVNTTDPYEGITMDPPGGTTTLEITSSGPWEIESRSARDMRVLDAPGNIEGNGDEVILVEGEFSKTNIKGNESEAHFAVRGYNPNPELLVNTTDNYEGTVKINKDTYVIDVTAVGDWTIELE